MSVYWTESTKSGLGDRMIDLLLMLTYSKINNKKLIMEWKEQPNKKTELENSRPQYRWSDYKLKKVLKYIKINNEVEFVDDIDINNITDNDILFKNYIGGVLSPHLFYNKYCNKICSLYIFMENYNSIIKNIGFRKMESYKIYDNIITIHLRRTDKVNNHSHICNGIDSGKLDELNNMTIETIQKTIDNGYKNFYFCGDDKTEIEKYHNMFDKFCNIIRYDCNDEIEQTYLDLYIMKNSKYIILSQYHSNFSVLGTLLGNAQMIYLFKECEISVIYKHLDKFLFYEDLFKKDYNESFNKDYKLYF